MAEPEQLRLFETPAERARRAGAALLWPAVIVAAVLVVMRDFAFEGRITNQHEDLLTLWLPYYCHVGTSVAAGQVPAFDPYVMGGVPFAADPQSGWGYLPAMSLFAVLPCDVAIRWYVVLLPVLAGLGTLWFLRIEGLSRPASAAGGLVLALAVAGSTLAISLPFAATFAWTALLLAAAGRYLRAPAWAARFAWAVVLALAWGQLAAAYLSNGIVLGTGALLAYGAVRLSTDVREGRKSRTEALAMAGIALAALPLANLLYLWPRLAYLPETTLGLGYRELQALGDSLAGRPVRGRLFATGMQAGWPLGFTASPGSYGGALALALSFAAWRPRPVRPLVGAFAGFGVACYLLSLAPVARWVNEQFGELDLAGFYLHDPARFRAGVLLALPVLVAAGVDALRRAETVEERVRLLVPGAVVWWLLPLLLGVDGAGSGVFWLGVAASVALGFGRAGPRAVATAVPAIVALELVLNGLSGRAVPFESSGISDNIAPSGAWPPLRRAALDAAAYVREGPIARTLRSLDGGRYLTVLPGAFPALGHLALQRPEFWGMLSNQRSILFRIEDAQGYNSVQPLRLWTFVRTVHPGIRYNLAFYGRPTELALDLLRVAWVVGSAEETPVPGAVPVVRDGPWALYGLPDPAPRAAVIGSWRVVGSAEAARLAIADPAFVPADEVVLESDPGVGQPGPVEGSATYRAAGPQEVVIDVISDRSAVLLIRNLFDPRWRATLDGRPADVLPADHVLQAVAVPAGSHTVRLTFEDHAIGYGAAGSAAAVGALLLAAVVSDPRRASRLWGPLARGRTPERAG